MDPTDEKEVGRMVGKDVVEEYILQIIGLLYYSNGGLILRHPPLWSHGQERACGALNSADFDHE